MKFTRILGLSLLAIGAFAEEDVADTTTNCDATLRTVQCYRGSSIVASVSRSGITPVCNNQNCRRCLASEDSNACCECVKAVRSWRGWGNRCSKINFDLEWARDVEVNYCM